jgi:hypothetical protein
METPTATLKNVSIIKVENGYVVSALGKSHIAKDAEEVKQLLVDKLPDVLTALDTMPPQPEPKEETQNG